MTRATSTYTGVDLGLAKVAVCAIDKNGSIVAEFSCSSDPKEIYSNFERFGLTESVALIESGPRSRLVCTALQELGLNVGRVDARRAHRTLSLRPNKTDASDAHGLAELARSGWYSRQSFRSKEMQRLRSAISVRDHLVKQKRRFRYQIRDYAHEFGLYEGSTAGHRFPTEMEKIYSDNPTHSLTLEPLIRAYRALDALEGDLTKSLERVAAKNEIATLLTSVPGVGFLTALSFIASVDDPNRFPNQKALSSYLGLSPRVRQSGVSRTMIGIGYTSETVTRRMLFMAAKAVIYVVKSPCPIQQWAAQLRERLPFKKCCVAVARKLTCIMFAIMRSGVSYRGEAKG